MSRVQIAHARAFGVNVAVFESNRTAPWRSFRESTARAAVDRIVHIYGDTNGTIHD